MIEIHMRSFGRTYSARATIDGKTYKITAVVGATNKLARMLRLKGVPDQPVNIYNPTGSLGISYSSLYKWADFDYLKERQRLSETKLKELLK